MAVNFQFHGLKKALFSKFFEMSDAELKDLGAYKFISDEYPCYPCRVSLKDAAVGESVLAISYEHNPVESPYRSSGPIFVRANALDTKPGINEVPEILIHRFLSIRGYDRHHRMIEAETVMGEDIEEVLADKLSNSSVEYIHVHNAGPGCFNCSVVRV